MTEKPAHEKNPSLQQIHGIGPGVTRRLSEAGIHDVADLAGAEPGIVAAALKGLPMMSQERIDEWIAEAGRLAPARQSASADNGQHYATFKVELLLDRRDEVRRTRVSHVQSGQGTSWAGWDAQRLNDVIMQSLGIRSSEEETTKLSGPPSAKSSGGLYLHDLKVCPSGSGQSQQMIRHGQPFDVSLGVAFTEALPIRAGRSARATTMLFARPIGMERRHQLSQSVAMLPLSREMDIKVSVFPGQEISSPGAYRLEVEFAMEAEGSREQLTASLSDGTLLVY